MIVVEGVVGRRACQIFADGLGEDTGSAGLRALTLELLGNAARARLLDRAGVGLRDIVGYSQVAEHDIAAGEGAVTSRAWDEILVRGWQMSEAMAIEMARSSEAAVTLRARQVFLGLRG